MFPVISGWLEADKEMQSYISQMKQTKYNDTVIQSRRKDAYFSSKSCRKTYDEILDFEKLGKADRLLYRPTPWYLGPVICNALRVSTMLTSRCRRAFAGVRLRLRAHRITMAM